MTVSQAELTHAHEPPAMPLLSHLPEVATAALVLAVVAAGWVALFWLVPVQLTPLRIG